MSVVECTITVDQPIQAVWAFLADFTTTEEWDPPTLSTRRTSGDGGVGTTYHNVAKFRGQRTEVEYVVTEYVEHQRLQLRGTTDVVALVDTFTVADTPSGTQVTFQEQVVPRSGGILPLSFQATAMERLGDYTTASLQDSLEHLTA